MKKYQEYLSKYTFPERVLPVQKWFAYHNGEVFGPFDDMDDATNISKNVELVVINQKEMDDRYNEVIRIDQLIQQEWYADLRNVYEDLNDETFNVIYNEAYDRGHCSGMDEVANYMLGYADVARRIIDANK